MNWDWIITILILIFLGLIIWARIERKTIKEVLEDIRDFVTDTKEDLEEEVTGGYYG